MKKVISILIAIVVAIVVLFGGIFTVNEGKRAAVFTNGEFSRIADPGLNFKVPVIQSKSEVNIKTAQVSLSMLAGTSDQQRVSSAVTVSYHLDTSKLPHIYAKVGIDNVVPIINKRVIGSSTTIISKYKAEDLLRQRDLVKTGIHELLSKQLDYYGVVIEDVQLTEFKFSEAYSKAIENKQIAEQEALAAVHKTNRIKEEANQSIEEAKGKAEAIRIQAEAIKANGGKEFLELQAIQRWDGVLPTTTMGNNTVPFINLNK